MTSTARDIAADTEYRGWAIRVWHAPYYAPSPAKWDWANLAWRWKATNPDLRLTFKGSAPSKAAAALAAVQSVDSANRGWPPTLDDGRPQD